ncbi:hypothetical protein FRB99_003684, partial [Tulasnella sp. 403]
MTTALFREVVVWAKLEHPNVIPFFGYFLSDDLKEARLVSPFMPYGDINKHLRRERPERQIRETLALGVARGLEYLHNLNPPQNILISEYRTAVLCDFGLAKVMEQRPSGMTTSTFNQCGTLAYESPELVLSKAYRERESDIFSGKPPYHTAYNVGAIIKWIGTDIPPAAVTSVNCPDYVRGILLGCWVPDPSARVTMRECTRALEGRSFPSRLTQGQLEQANSTASHGTFYREWESTYNLSQQVVQLLSWNLTVDRNFEVHPDAFGHSVDGILEKDDLNPVLAFVRQLPEVPSGKEHARWYTALKQEALAWTATAHPNIARFVSIHVDNAMTCSLSYSRDAADIDLSDFLRNPILDHARRLEIRSVSINQDSHVRLRDYGFASVASEISPALNVDEAQVTNSWRYSSPEVIAGVAPDEKSDIWSFGSIVLE